MHKSRERSVTGWSDNESQSMMNKNQNCKSPECDKFMNKQDMDNYVHKHLTSKCSKHTFCRTEKLRSIDDDKEEKKILAQRMKHQSTDAIYDNQNESGSDRISIREKKSLYQYEGKHNQSNSKPDEEEMWDTSLIDTDTRKIVVTEYSLDYWLAQQYNVSLLNFPMAKPNNMPKELFEYLKKKHRSNDTFTFEKKKKDKPLKNIQSRIAHQMRHTN